MLWMIHREKRLWIIQCLRFNGFVVVSKKFPPKESERNKDRINRTGPQDRTMFCPYNIKNRDFSTSLEMTSGKVGMIC